MEFAGNRRSNKVVLVATTFTGNVPYYDIIASDETGRHVSVQVKASSGGSWQFADLRNFCDITFAGKRQVVGKPKPYPVRRLVMVFVTIGETGQDRFYICSWAALRDLIIKRHKEYLRQHGGIRPQRWDSLHTAIKQNVLRPFQDKWATIKGNLR